jgi:hypothetical protein
MCFKCYFKFSRHSLWEFASKFYILHQESGFSLRKIVLIVNRNCNRSRSARFHSNMMHMEQKRDIVFTYGRWISRQIPLHPTLSEKYSLRTSQIS